MRRLCFVFPSVDSDGPSSWAWRTATGLADRGMEVHAVLLRQAEDAPLPDSIGLETPRRPTLHAMGWPVDRRGRVSASTRRRWELAGLLRRIGPDVVHYIGPIGGHPGRRHRPAVVASPGAVVVLTEADTAPSASASASASARPPRYVDALTLPDGRPHPASISQAASMAMPLGPGMAFGDDGPIEDESIAESWRLDGYLAWLDHLRRSRRVRFDRPHEALSPPHVGRPSVAERPRRR